MTPTGEFGKRGFHPQGSRRPAKPAETGKMRPLVIGIVIGVVATPLTLSSVSSARP